MAIRLLLMRAIAILLLFSASAMAQEKTPVIPPHVCGPAVLERGIASVYSDSLHGSKTANDEFYDREKLTAAHPKLPFGTRVEIEDDKTHRKVMVRINDRGPYVKGRIIDISNAARVELGRTKKRGVYKVTLRLCK